MVIGLQSFRVEAALKNGLEVRESFMLTGGWCRRAYSLTQVSDVRKHGLLGHTCKGEEQVE
jgi:hypothetical protein